MTCFVVFTNELGIFDVELYREFTTFRTSLAVRKATFAVRKTTRFLTLKPRVNFKLSE